MSDLIEIMNLGNELYSYLSHSAQKEYLMFSEMPEVVCVREYNLQYSESCHGNIFLTEIIPESIAVPLEVAVESVLAQGYKSLMLTIGTLTVAIFHVSDGCFKIFDSHSRNARGMSGPMGSCVLLELTSVVELVEYFQELYLGTLNIEFELKGIEITRTDEVILDENKKEKSDEEERSSGWLRCCFICLYALCFSVIKQIKFWNNETLESIISHAENEFKNLPIKKDCNIFDIANPVIIQGAPVEVSFNEVREAVIEEEICAVCNQMKTNIMQKQDKNTGLLV